MAQGGGGLTGQRRGSAWQKGLLRGSIPLRAEGGAHESQRCRPWRTGGVLGRQPGRTEGIG